MNSSGVVLLWIAGMLFLEGCTYYMPAAVSSTTIGTKNEVPVAVATGESSAEYVLFFGPFGDDSLGAALKNAKQRAGVDADSMANSFVDRKIFCFPFSPPFCWYKSISTTVHGTLVKYRDDQGQSMATPVTPLNGEVGEALYNKTSTLFLKDSSTAASLAAAYVDALSAKDKDSLMSYVTNVKGLSYWGTGRLVMRQTNDKERQFLEWFVKTYTGHTAVFKNQ